MKRIPGTNPLLENKRISEELVDRKKRYREILEILKESEEPMTAKEIAVEMNRRGYTPTAERNFSAPRLTELLKTGQVDCVGSKICEFTGRPVSTFVRRKVETNG